MQFHRTRIRTLTFVLMAVSILLMAPRCDVQPVSATGSTEFNPATGGYEGLADVRIGRTMFEDVAVVTIIIEQQVDPNTGIVTAITSHTFDFGNGDSFTTTDDAVLTPSDPADPCAVYDLQANMVIDSGTGRFEEAHGGLCGSGEIFLPIVPPCTGPFVANWDFHGWICFNRGHDDDAHE